MSYNCPKRGQQQMQQGMQQQQVQQPTQQLAQQQQPDMAAMAKEVAREVARSMAEQMGTTAATSPRVDAGNREEMAANPIVQSVMDPMQLAQFKEGLLKDIKDMVDEAVADTPGCRYPFTLIRRVGQGDLVPLKCFQTGSGQGEPFSCFFKKKNNAQRLLGLPQGDLLCRADAGHQLRCDWYPDGLINLVTEQSSVHF